MSDTSRFPCTTSAPSSLRLYTTASGKLRCEKKLNKKRKGGNALKAAFTKLIFQAFCRFILDQTPQEKKVYAK